MGGICPELTVLNNSLPSSVCLSTRTHYFHGMQTPQFPLCRWQIEQVWEGTRQHLPASGVSDNQHEHWNTQRTETLCYPPKQSLACHQGPLATSDLHNLSQWVHGYTGPFKVLKQITKVNYRLKMLRNSHTAPSFSDLWSKSVVFPEWVLREGSIGLSQSACLVSQNSLSTLPWPHIPRCTQLIMFSQHAHQSVITTGTICWTFTYIINVK